MKRFSENNDLEWEVTKETVNNFRKMIDFRECSLTLEEEVEEGRRVVSIFSSFVKSNRNQLDFINTKLQDKAFTTQFNAIIAKKIITKSTTQDEGCMLKNVFESMLDMVFVEKIPLNEAVNAIKRECAQLELAHFFFNQVLSNIPFKDFVADYKVRFQNKMSAESALELKNQLRDCFLNFLKPHLLTPHLPLLDEQLAKGLTFATTDLFKKRENQGHLEKILGDLSTLLTDVFCRYKTVTQSWNDMVDKFQKDKEKTKQHRIFLNTF